MLNRRRLEPHCELISPVRSGCSMDCSREQASTRTCLLGRRSGGCGADVASTMRASPIVALIGPLGRCAQPRPASSHVAARGAHWTKLVSDIVSARAPVTIITNLRFLTTRIELFSASANKCADGDTFGQLGPARGTGAGVITMDIYEVEVCRCGRWEQRDARVVAARDAEEAALRSEGEPRKVRLRVRTLGNGSPPPKLFYAL
jgi:hypothetical protein